VKKNVAIIGCGIIGSRHLQALVKTNFPLNIHVVEKHSKSKNTAISLLKEISYNKKNHKIFWHQSLTKFKEECDLVIISTRSPNRVKIISKLLQKGYKKFLIEKIVCQSTTEYKLLMKEMKKFSALAWINTPRRYFQSYQKIKNYIQHAKFLHLSVFCENVGLGTNSIHYIDLFSWLIDDYSLKLKGDFLLPKVFPSKRGKDFKEFFGTINGSNFSNTHSLQITSLPSSRDNMYVIISTDLGQYVIDELNQKMVFMNVKSLKSKFLFEYTSSITTKIVSDIFDKNSCLLPTLPNSFIAHTEIFKIFNNHIKKQLKRDVSLCPIT
jgi:hypothetical protein